MKNLRKNDSRRNAFGYTLIEVLMASGVMMIAVAAAAQLSLVMVTQEETNHRIKRCLAMNEGAAQLFRLGLSPAEIRALLPGEPAAGAYSSSLSIIQSNVAVPNVGTMVQGECSLTFDTTLSSGTYLSGQWSGGSNAATRTSVIPVLRPSMN